MTFATLGQKSINTKGSSIDHFSFLTPKCYRGFTLAEVLITLVVLGIIAAVTIPTLRQSLDDKKYKVPLKKTYAVLSEALEQAFRFTDFDINGVQSGSWQKELETLLNEYVFKSLAVARVCCKTQGGVFGSGDCAYDGANGFSNNDCFSSDVKSLDNVTKSRTNYGVAFTLKDGTSVLFAIWHGTRQDGFIEPMKKYGIDGNNKTTLSKPGTQSCPTCTVVFYDIYVDVNGTKGPNIAGKDVHAFIYTKSHGLLPAGVDVNTDTSLASDCNGADNWGCTYDYLFGSDE